MKISSCARTLSCPMYSARVGGLSERSNCSSCGETGRAEIMRSGSTLIGVLPEALEAEFRADRKHLDLELVGALPFGARRPVCGEGVLHSAVRALRKRGLPDH